MSQYFRGQALILIAIAIAALLGMTALAVDTGNVYLDRRSSQSAADAAALAAARALVRGEDGVAAGLRMAAINGYVNGPGVNVYVNVPPINYIDNNDDGINDCNNIGDGDYGGQDQNHDEDDDNDGVPDSDDDDDDNDGIDDDEDDDDDNDGIDDEEDDDDNDNDNDGEENDEDDDDDNDGIPDDEDNNTSHDNDHDDDGIDDDQDDDDDNDGIDDEDDNDYDNDGIEDDEDEDDDNDGIDDEEDDDDNDDDNDGVDDNEDEDDDNDGIDDEEDEDNESEDNDHDNDGIDDDEDEDDDNDGIDDNEDEDDDNDGNPEPNEEQCTSNPYANDPSYVQVIITSKVDTYFAPIVGVNKVTNVVQAIARAKPAMTSPIAFGNAVVALKPNGASTFWLHGNPRVTTVGGGIFVNSSTDCGFTSSGTPNLSTPNITMVAARSCPQLVGPGITYNAPQLPYPPENLPNPVCEGAAVRNGNTLSPGTWNGSFPPSGVTQLQPGVYCVNGNFTLNGNDTLTGNDVVIVMQSGYIRWNGNGALHLSAPTSGPFKGLLIYFPMSNNSEIRINGTSDQLLTGTILAPASPIVLLGTAGTDAYHTQMIGYTVEFGGTFDGIIRYNDEENYDVSVPPQVELVR